MRILLVLLLATNSLYGFAQQSVLKNGRTYTYYEQMPEFPGDLEAYLTKNRRYTSVQANSGLEGGAIVRFLICDDGRVADPRLVRSSGFTSLDSEAVRLVRMMPPWKPGRGVNNRLADVVYYLPITFRAD